MRSVLCAGVLVLTVFGVPDITLAQAQSFEPQVFQSGKDVVWVPTSQVLVEKMLDMANVTPDDDVVDLGSGDGRNVISAAKRGARARGFEYNPNMVALSRRLASEAGVADKATFVEGDMFEADFSTASVLALFLLPINFDRLRDKFLDLKPGSRIVVNTFGVGGGWEPDATEKLETGCDSWCTAMLYVVPAKVGGAWRLGKDVLVLTQHFQVVDGSLESSRSKTLLTNGRLNGNQVAFTIGTTAYRGTINGDRIEGTAGTGQQQEPWTATRVRN